jgi:hypothetical protein
MLRTDEMGQLPAFDRTDVLDAFLEAARFAGDALGAEEVERLWLTPSALAQMSVGDLAGHILLVMRRVSQHIDSDRHLVPGSTAADLAPSLWAWLRVAGPEDLDRPEHRQVRSDSAFVAAWGCQAVRASFRRYYERVASVLPEACPAIAKVGDHTLPFSSYLATRIVELLVHCDDLCYSISIQMAPPTGAVEVALQALVPAACSLYGDLAVIRTLARPDRAPSTISVF